MLVAKTEHVDAALDILVEIEVSDALQERSKQLVALGNGSTQTLVVGIEVVEESFHVVLTRFSYGTVFDGTEVITQRSVQLRVILGCVRHIDEEL